MRIQKMSNTKVKIDYEKKLRQCSECRTMMPFSSFQSNGYSATGKTRCRICHNKFERQYKRERAMEKDPSKYNQCNNEDCNFVWFKQEGNHCPQCGSALVWKAV